MISRAATRCIGRLFCAVGLGLALGIGPACAAESAPDVDVQFVEHSPKILEHLRSKEFRNVGVLKFRVQKEGGGLTDNSGPLNLELAEKLELALLIATPLKNPLGIIHAASAVAAKTPGANHLTAAGRQELFSLPYVLAWGQGEVSADAFLTGDVVLSADRAEMNIKVFAFDAQSPALELVAQFDAGLDVGMLSDAGESFVLRGVPEVDRSGANPSDREQSDPGRANTDPSERASADAAECARRVRRQAEPFPLLDPAAPMELQILYDGHPQTIEVHHGKAFVSEPRRREEVTFAIKRRHQEDRTRYLAVLKINGENSIRPPKAERLRVHKVVRRS